MNTLQDIASWLLFGLLVWCALYSSAYAVSLGWHTARQKRPMNVDVNLKGQE